MSGIHADDKTKATATHIETLTPVDTEKRSATSVGEEEISEADNKRLRRRIDWMLMPLLCTVYGLQYVGCGRDMERQRAHGA